MASTMVSSSVKDDSFNQELLIQTEIQSLSKSAAQSFDNDDISQALRMFKTAFLLSCKLTEKQTQKACLFNLGAAYISAGKPQKGLKCLLKSKAEGSEATDASLYFNIAAAYDEMKEPTKAVKFYEKAIKSYGLSEINNIADALIKLSYCSVVTGNLPSAAHTFKLAGQAYQKLKKTDDAVMAMREAANYMIQSQKFSKLEVLSTLNICVQLCAGVTDKSLLGKLYNHIGLHYAEMKCFGQARQCFAESLDTCKGTSFSIRKKAVLLQNLGAIDNALGQYETSLRCHAEAADMYGTLGERHAQGQCLCNLAFAYSQLKNYNMAEFYYQQALCAFSDVGEIHGQWQACEGLGAIHFCLGNKDQAISYYKQALSLFGKSKETSDILRERILGKLVHVIEQKAMHQHPVSCGKSIPGTKAAIFVFFFTYFKAKFYKKTIWKKNI
ncbi:tetratricopeptide repeat protein 24 isoform X2 [Microcaecilia unicolor]|uniref:Tetratricopeptide repeat protein 24-like isoform X2 n=1 Tax=Microcaecilia unicolor TaxID=1415580 RepID=A0A6P7WU56_9AMPH|nr:tetratricopeptide repeat protein 24-like isoform X2 [Microcaecilia unicolor]